MKFIRKYGLILFIIALIAFIGFHIYRNLVQDVPFTPPPSSKVSNKTPNKNSVNNDTKGFSLKNPNNKDQSLPQKTESKVEDEADEIETPQDIKLENIDDITDAGLLGDDTSGVELIEDTEQDSQPQTPQNEEILPIIEETDIDNNADDPIEMNDVFIEEPDSSPSLDTSPNKDIDDIKQETDEKSPIDTSPNKNTDDKTNEDNPFSDDELIGDDNIYATLTDDEDIIADDENQDFVENTPEDKATGTEIDAADDIFNDPNIGLESDNQPKNDDIFTETDTTTSQENDTSEQSPQEDLDDEFLSQIDIPDDLLLPDERKINEKEIMITPTKDPEKEKKDADEDGDYNEIPESFFPDDDAESQDQPKTAADNDIIETNKALSPKENWDTDDILGEDDLYSDIAPEDDLLDDKSQEDTDNMFNFPLVTKDDPNLQKPALLKKEDKLTAQEKIAITPFTTMTEASAHCHFEHVIDAHQMSEQFRLTVMPPTGQTPLKMQMERDLSLQKFLTMKMDEIDGYPDAFSSLSVFCKDMTVDKRLIENY